MATRASNDGDFFLEDNDHGADGQKLDYTKSYVFSTIAVDSGDEEIWRARSEQIRNQAEGQTRSQNPSTHTLHCHTSYSYSI